MTLPSKYEKCPLPPSEFFSGFPITHSLSFSWTSRSLYPNLSAVSLQFWPCRAVVFALLPQYSLGFGGVGGGHRSALCKSGISMHSDAAEVLTHDDRITTDKWSHFLNFIVFLKCIFWGKSVGMTLRATLKFKDNFSSFVYLLKNRCECMLSFRSSFCSSLF